MTTSILVLGSIALTILAVLVFVIPFLRPPLGKGEGTVATPGSSAAPATGIAGIPARGLGIFRAYRWGWIVPLGIVLLIAVAWYLGLFAILLAFLSGLASPLGGIPDMAALWSKWGWLIVLIAVGTFILYLIGSKSRPVQYLGGAIAAFVLLVWVGIPVYNWATSPWNFPSYTTAPVHTAPTGMRTAASGCTAVALPAIPLDSDPVKLPDNCNIHYNVTEGVVRFKDRRGMTIDVPAGTKVVWPEDFKPFVMYAKTGRAEIWPAFCPRSRPRWNNGCTT